MDLYVLGSGTCVPTAERGPSGLALSFLSHLMLFDGGGGSLHALARAGLDFRRIDFVGITHFHPDHASDLVPLLFAMNYAVDFTRSLPLHIIGPRGLKDFYARLRSVFGRWIEAHSYPLFFHEMGEDRLPFPDFEVLSAPMDHPTEAVGFRIEAERAAFAYSGDTDYGPHIVGLGHEADLLVLECSFPDHRKKPGHLTPSLAGRIAREACCRRLLLTHFYPLFQGQDILGACRAEFGGEILLAEDGMKLAV